MMLRSDEHWLAMADAFSAAGLGAGSWLDALSRLADATGSRAGELIGLGGANNVPFHWVTDLGQDWLEEFLAVGGADPAFNPHVRVGSEIPAMRVLSSGEFIGQKARRRDPFFAEHVDRYDIPYICLTPLVKEPDMLVGLSVMRSARQGEIEPAQREVFARMAPHVRAAVRTQMALEHQGALLVAGAMEALSLAVFVCDRLGAVRAMTPAAEALVSTGDGLRLRRNVLGGTRPAETRAIGDAIAGATGGPRGPGAPPPAATLVIRGRLAQPLILEVVPLPRRAYAFGFEPRALVIVRGSPPDPARLGTLLQTAYGLTAAEVDVAVRLSVGQPPDAIAAARATSVATVRVQIRAIYTKLDVHHLSGLAAHLNQLR